MVAFIKATKKQTKIKAGLYGPAGCGKTFGMLRMATGMAAVCKKNGGTGKIAGIDSEAGRMRKYADRFDFDVHELGDGERSPSNYIAALEAAADGLYDVVIVDSMSHAWRSLLDDVDEAQKRHKGNKWAAWSEGTPEQKKLVEAILRCPFHLLASMRSDTKWETKLNDKGKNEPQRIGLKPEQGKGIEYEFDMLIAVDTDHSVRFEKSIVGDWQDKYLELLTEEVGAKIATWCLDGVRPMTPSQGAIIRAKLLDAGVVRSPLMTVAALVDPKAPRNPDTFEDGERVIAGLDRMIAERVANPPSAPATQPTGASLPAQTPAATVPTSTASTSGPPAAAAQTPPAGPVDGAGRGATSTTMAPGAGSPRPTPSATSPATVESRMAKRRRQLEALAAAGQADSEDMDELDNLRADDDEPDPEAAADLHQRLAADHPTPAPSTPSASTTAPPAEQSVNASNGTPATSPSTPSVAPSTAPTSAPPSTATPAASSPPPTSGSPDGGSTKPVRKPTGARSTSEILAFCAAIDVCRKAADVDESVKAWDDRLGLLPRKEARDWCNAYAMTVKHKLAGDTIELPEWVAPAAAKIAQLRGTKAA